MSTLGTSGDAPTVPSADPILTTKLGDGDEMAAALVSAFSDHRVDVDPAEREPLHEWVSLEAVEALFASTTDARLDAVVWDHRVVLTGEAVQVVERVTPVA